MKKINRNILSICISLLEWILLAALLITTFFLSERYEKLAVNTDDYIQLEEQADIIREASDYLTEQVRLFVMIMDIQYAELYFEEANVTQRRENALATLQGYRWADVWEEPVSKAVQYSNALMEQEIYAMKLIAVANGYQASVLPTELQEIQLEPADAALEPADMIDKARNMMFNTQYQLTKNTIYDNLSVYTQGILLEAENEVEVGKDSLTKTTAMLRFLIGAFAVLVVLKFAIRRLP